MTEHANALLRIPAHPARAHRRPNRARFILLPLAALLLLPACRENQPETAVAAAQANALALADERRVLDLEGGVNFRDLGGYLTEDGRLVKWEMVYRSGSPAGLTAADQAELARRGIRTICDLRASEERAAEPSPFAAPGSNISYYTRDYALEMGDIGSLLSAPDVSADTMRQLMTGFYRELPYQQAESLAEMFRLLAGGSVPLAFNCSAGKDRTGIAAALILTALGVPRETVLADYAMSDNLVDYRSQLAEGAAKNPSYAALARLPWEVVEPLMASDPAYLAAALAEVEARNGSIDQFLEQELGVTQAMRQRIRELLTEA